jgi:hypothetical protein
MGKSQKPSSLCRDRLPLENPAGSAKEQELLLGVAFDRHMKKWHSKENSSQTTVSEE